MAPWPMVTAALLPILTALTSSFSLPPALALTLDTGTFEQTAPGFRIIALSHSGIGRTEHLLDPGFGKAGAPACGDLLLLGDQVLRIELPQR